MTDVPPEPLEVMFQETHDYYVEGGCDPHCHICGAKISIGDAFKMKVFITDAVTPTGLKVGNIQGMICRPCAEADRDLPPEEMSRLEERIRGIKAPTPRLNEERKKVVEKLSPPPPRPVSRGAYVLPDGTIL